MSRAAKLLLLLVATAVFALVLYAPIERRVSAALLLSRLRNPAPTESTQDSPVRSTPAQELALADGSLVKGRFYGPSEGEARITIILGHGVHPLGIEEPRLVRFAQHLASSNCRVYTPELEDLRTLKISDRSIEVFRRAVDNLKRPDQRLGLVGISFAGGLALRAAEAPETAAALNYVASVGGHHDLSRTLQFIATNRATGPEGTRNQTANAYGLVVILNEYLSSFNLAEEDAVRALLQLWIRGQKSEAKEQAEELETQSAYDLVQLVLAESQSELSDKLLPLIGKDGARLAQLSPRARLGTIGTQVILIHGFNDDVIPREETLFAADELSQTDVPWKMLITPLVDHVGHNNPGGFGEKLKLVNIMSRLL